MIQDTDFNGDLVVLIYAKTAEQVKVGEVVNSGRGVDYVVMGGRAGQTPPSSGRVWVRPVDGGIQTEYFPNVFDMKWAKI